MIFDFLKKYSEQFDGASHKDVKDDVPSSQPSKTEKNHIQRSSRKDADRMTRRHLVFRGSVQGVGFRYTAHHLAESLGLTGWVQNEYDGSVSCEVQGPSYVIEEFLRRLNDQRWIRIMDMDSETMDVISDEKSFRITY
ncbi:acylphosphatase [Oribacterium sp. P6A1]|uniref:acylphosphatase n=1 Tax=Oribacterium sp. P6A1 TaxID=1410612 RepID=UPI000AF58224|nr:acylphosphatase [Oribacterium sp. P6A1]